MQPHRPHQKGQDEDFGIKPAEAIKLAKQHQDVMPGRPAGEKTLGSGNSVREHGVGSTGGHPGKGSGGDIDTDLLGLEPLPARPEDDLRNPDGTPNIGAAPLPHGHIQPSGPEAARRGELEESQSGGGVANNRGHTESDDFVSEITFDEADGRDESKGG